MVSFLLPVPPEGLGTSDIEALDSYVERLALAHCVTQHHLCVVLREWWGKTKNSDEPELSRYLGQVHKCGCGHDVEGLVRALERSTGFDGLSAMTLRAFTDVSGPHIANILHHVHHWCPACMKEWHDDEKAPYEKLIWRLNPIETDKLNRPTRCHLHKLQLVNSCPHCGSRQIRHWKRTWFHCSECAGLLFDDMSKWVYAPSPSYGEKDLIDVIEYCAKNPKKVFSKDAPEQFFRSVKWRHRNGRVADVVGDYFHSRNDSNRTLLTSLLRVAQYFNTPLLEILTEAALSPISVQLEEEPPRPVTPHPKQLQRPAYVREKLREEVETSLSQGLEGKSIKKICHELEVSATTANRWFPDLMPQLARHQENLRIDRRNRQIALLETISYQDLILEMDAVGWHTLPHVIARRLGVPVHLARERIAQLRRARRHFGEK